ncbi:MAG TPA: sensor histidine kinase, partial [Bacillota bacterium]|nr:sensor histidine kinase [Bacillota bacterium]
LVFDLAWWHGWGPVPNALLGFTFAVLFTLVFTLLAVSSERARGEVQRLASELSDANRQLREYAVQAEELAATRERNRLAREIHDTVGHCLTVVNVQLEAARTLRAHAPERMADALDKAQRLTQQGLQEIRRSVASLRASPVDDKPLAEALRQIVAESQAAGLTTELCVQGEARPLSPQAQLTLYRAGQEGLTNARKHAHATSTRLLLDFQAPDKVRLSVRDDGVGAASASGAAGGFGLLGLRERAQLLGGALRVQTAPGAGFTLEVEVPA